MKRRELLALVGTGGLLTIIGTTGSTAVVTTRFLELRIGGEPGELPFAVEEFGPGGQSAGVVRFEDERGLALFLTRTRKDPDAPKQLRLAVANGSTLDRVWAAVKASRAGGFGQVRYYGCIPPGCGLVAGETPNQTRYAGTVYKLETLDRILSENWTKC
jgi:hypothetical protein